jgi:HK97 family phage prohead protease
MTTEPAETVPEGSIRSVDFVISDTDDGLTLEGYAAVFDSPTHISNRFEGDFTETINRGAFANVIRANPKPVMQFDHGLDTAIGSTPIGAIQSMREDDKGLWVSARLHDNWLSLPVRHAIESGSLHGMSFRFLTPEDGSGEEWSDDRSTRSVTDISYLPELGPVTFPAYADTEVSVRARKFADAVDPELLEDFSIGLLLANHRDELLDTADEQSDSPTPDEEADAREDNVTIEAGRFDAAVETFVVETPAPADSDGVRVANPAKHALALMAVRTDLATQRSRLATHELSDR